MDQTPGTWIVRLDPDTGMLFYQESASKETSWYDPWLADRERGEHNPLEDVIDTLVGYEEAVRGKSNPLFHSDHIDFARDQISQWMERDNLVPPEFVMRMKLRWPTFYDVRSIGDKIESGTPLRIEINLPNHGSGSQMVDCITIPLKPLGMTVGTLKHKLFKKYASRSSGDALLHPQGPDYCVFKMAGYEDYMLWDHYTVFSHENVRRDLLGERTCRLNLVTLSEREYEDLSRYQRKYNRWVDPCPPLGLDDGAAKTAAADFQMPRALAELAPAASDWRSMQVICVDQCRWHFRVKVRALELMDKFLQDELYRHEEEGFRVQRVRVEIALYIDGHLIRDTNGELVTLRTKPWHPGGGESAADDKSAQYEPLAEQMIWPDVWLKALSLPLCNLRPETRVSCTLHGLTNTGDEIKIANASVMLFDHQGHMRNGIVTLRMWGWPSARRLKKDEKAKAPWQTKGPHSQNPARVAPILHIEFDQFEFPVVAWSPTMSQAQKVVRELAQLNPPDRHTYHSPPSSLVQLIETFTSDPLYEMNETDRRLLWQSRKLLRSQSGYEHLLGKILQCCDCSYNENLWKARQYLLQHNTHKLNTNARLLVALDLLGGKFSDPVMRGYAANLLSYLPDSTLVKFMMQLVQALKFEKNYDSMLARLLLRRALHSPIVVGQPLYWMLRAEMHNPHVCERYGLLLELYVRNCGVFNRHALKDQADVNRSFRCVATVVASLKGERSDKKKNRDTIARAELEKMAIGLPGSFSLCLSPRFKATGLIVKKCKVMNSARAPLWLTLKNADTADKAEDLRVIFKCGDDLRQDSLTMQLLRVMESLWLKDGYNLKMRPYNCVATGEDRGMLEVVPRAWTITRIVCPQSSRVLGAVQAMLNTNPNAIKSWLKTQCRAVGLDASVETFKRSAAAYCVATFVLGIGDRHPSNIMLDQTGHLFHIDFGHFLGNFKTKGFIKRETVPFVFTPYMLYVLGKDLTDPKPTEFVQLCTKCLLTLRAHASLLVRLLSLMIPAGMPELRKEADIEYLKKQMLFKTKDRDLHKTFLQIVKGCVHSLNSLNDTVFNVSAHILING